MSKNERGSKWLLKFTREMSLPTFYLIFKGYQGMLKEFGDAFEFLMYVGKDDLTRGYRQDWDDARFSSGCKEALDEEGLAEKVLDEIEKRFGRFEKKQEKALSNPLNPENVSEAFDAFESLWKLYIIPLYWGTALEEKPQHPLLNRIRQVRERTGGTVHQKGAEGLLEEIIDSAARLLSKKTQMPASLFQFTTPDELIGCLQGKTPPKLVLEQRKRIWVLLQKKSRFKLYAGGEAEKIARNELGEEKLVPDWPLKGTVVYGTGTVEGTARVAFKQSEAAKLLEGEILVTPMTTPEMVPALKKVKAIITDEGGLMCHAAILARELKIPCLVGTKEATRVFHTNDRDRKSVV